MFSTRYRRMGSWYGVDAEPVYASSMTTGAVNFKELPISERIQLVEDIWDSIAEETTISPQLSPEQRAELHRRYANHQANPSSSLSWQQVRTALFKNQV